MNHSKRRRVNPARPNQAERHFMYQNELTFDDIAAAWTGTGSTKSYISRLMSKPLTPEMRDKFLEAAGLALARKRIEVRNAKSA